MRYLKFILFVVTAVLGSAGVSLVSPDGLSGQNLLNVVVLALTAAGVYFKANTPTQPWAKTVVAVFGAGVAVVISAWTDRAFDSFEVVQIVLAVLGALQVAVAANVPPGSQPEATTSSSTGSVNGSATPSLFEREDGIGL